MSSGIHDLVGVRTRLTRGCVTCATRASSLTGRYRAFLLDPGTLFTAAATLLLIAAIIVTPSGAVSSAGAHGGLYVVAALVGCVYIWWSAVESIRERDFTADIPVSIATIAALAIGQYSAAAVVAVLLLLGGLLEEFVAARAGRALDTLEALLPATVTVRRAGEDVPVALQDVRTGDVVLVRGGERIAVDGEVVAGAAAVDQAAITGESVPVDKTTGDPVFAGTLNGSGVLQIRATRIGEETTLGQIRRMVAEAQENKAPVERILDRYAKLYTPVALVLAAVLWAVTGDPLRAITMLIVFCPCVMVLATPTALVASIGNAALRGSLIKQGATVEAAARIDTVVFDKTGTLTHGQPRLVDVVALDGLDADALLTLAASAEKFSEHPLARAIVRAAADRGLHVADPDSFDAQAGIGVQARTAGRSVVLGRPALFTGHAVDEALAQHAASGASVVVLAVDQQPAGLLVLEDQPRREARPTLDRLHAMGLRTVLISGDQRSSAQRIADELGITELHAEVLPQDKARIVQELRAAGRNVAFVGDGINDGPALATADVGVAMGLTGTDLALQTAQIALLCDDLSKLPHLLTVSRTAMRAIHQNLVFSLAVLAGAVALTIAGILHPVSGALLHELSSIPVIANSARIIGLPDRPRRLMPMDRAVTST